MIGSRVAVMGVPRGGTSLTVGLLRILGYELPEGATNETCPFGESPTHRLLENPGAPTVNRLVKHVSELPPGTVWKDPAVGEYAHLIDWSTWDVVSVYRPPALVMESEKRWGHTVLRADQRAQRWYQAMGKARDVTHPRRSLNLDLRDIREDPVWALHKMALRLGLETDPWLDLMAKMFVQPSGGYQCPVVGACSVCGTRPIP